MKRPRLHTEPLEAECDESQCIECRNTTEHGVNLDAWCCVGCRKHFHTACLDDRHVQSRLAERLCPHCCSAPTVGTLRESVARARRDAARARLDAARAQRDAESAERETKREKLEESYAMYMRNDAALLHRILAGVVALRSAVQRAAPQNHNA